MGRVGMYFTLDALFATVLLGLGIVLSTQMYISDVDHPQLTYYSQDIISSLSNIRITEVNDTYIQSMIASGEILHPNNSVIEQIGEFYVLNKTEEAQNLSRIVSQKLVPQKYGFEMLVNNDRIYGESAANARELVSQRRMISGIEKFKPLKGATSKVYLEGFNNKIFSSYQYFGGFVGQGNITVNLTEIPSDAVFYNMELELDVAGDFDMSINGNHCDSFSPATSLTVADRWNITDCTNLLNKGEENKIDIIFDDLLNESFIAGGFLRVDYRTEELSGYFEGYKIRYRFPGVSGIVNLFDAFYVPGTVEKMNIFLHFQSNETTYLTVGGKIIHKWQGTDGDEYFNITDQNLSTSAYFNLKDDYDLFSNNTVPIRFASYEAIEEVITGGNADVVLISDLSGSMKSATDDWSLGNSAPTCNNYYDNPDTRRTRAAVCLDVEMADIVMNYSGNRMWPIFMRDNSILDYPWDPEIKEDVIDTINNYYNDQGKDKTCIACAINQGYDILKANSDSSREKVMVLMTDGCPTHCADDAGNTCQSNSTIYGLKTCEGLCDTSGACGDIASQCNDCTNNQGAVDNAIYSAQRAYDDLNITIFTVGFGPMDDCELGEYALSTIANITNGTYQHSRNTSELRGIYQNISYEILERISQSSQLITSRGNLTDAVLYPDSFIEVEYDPIAEQPAFDEIAVAIEEDKFNTCSPTFDVPQGLRVTDAKVTSYSGEHWTNKLDINGKNIYSLSSFLLDYVRLGDPFFVYVPVNNIRNGTNTLYIETADSPQNITGCSDDNTIIYTGLIRSSISYADVLPDSIGCTWTLEFEDGTTSMLNVPQSYSGTKTCEYTSTSISYDANDSIDSAAFSLFDNLDYNDDGQIFVNFDEFNLVVNAISVQQIPYPWGPAMSEVRVWR